MNDKINKWTKQGIVNSCTCSCIEQTNYSSLSVLTYFIIVQEKDSYVTEFKNKDVIITTLQKQLVQSNQQSKYTCVYMYVGLMDRYMVVYR